MPLSATFNVQPNTQKKRIGLVILGQSNENGAVLLDYLNDSPQAFQSLRNPTITSDFVGNNSIGKVDNFRWQASGSPWCKTYDDLYDAGYELLIRNCSIGSASWVNDAVGQILTHFPDSQGTRCRRKPIHPSDGGCGGMIIKESGHLFESIVGTETYAYLKNEGGQLYTASGGKMPPEIDYIYSPIPERKSTASVKPDFSQVSAVGDTVVDGEVVWECIELNTTLDTGYQFRQGLKGLLPFDPLGIMRRTARHAKELRNQGAERIIVYICNGQSDADEAQVKYQTAVDYMTQFFRAQGFEVALGLSTYFAGSMSGGYDNMTNAINAVLTKFESDSGVHKGANLYEDMGTVVGENGLLFDNSNVHLTGEGAIVAGMHHANAIKRILGVE